MSVQTLSTLLPSLRLSLTAVISGILGAVLSAVLFVWIIPHSSDPKPLPLHDPHFAVLGKAYLPQLGKAYAEAWNDGATLLESGQGLPVALDAVKKSWDSNRAELFERIATPEFAKLVPESTKDADITPTARAGLASAWRGFAIGLTR